MPQKIIQGITGLEEAVSSLDMRNVLLVSGSSLQYLSIKYSFHNAIRFDAFTPNPLYEQVCEGVKLFNDNHCDGIIAVGGGSAIDVAKCIKLFCGMDSSVNYLKQDYTDSKVPLIAVPTTAGTGSESTQHAVIYFQGEKQSISHPCIIPNYAVLEPSVLKTLPLYQKKCTMLDALSQGIESWWSVNSTDESREYAKKAIETIIANYKAYIFTNDDEAAEQIMLAANYAGRAINITKTTAPHAMSYKLTSLYKLPHGHAVAVCLPVVWKYMLDNLDKCNDSRGQAYLSGILADIPLNAEQFTLLLAELDIGSPVSSEREKELDLLTHSVNPERLKNNPVELSCEVLHAIYERIVR